MVTVAKMTDGRTVEVVRVSETVPFSPERSWILMCFDWQTSERRKSQFKWVHASTVHFEWVRDYIGEAE